MIKHILGCIALATIVMASNPAAADEAPPTSEQATKIEAMVNKAAALCESKGKAAFTEFSKRDSEWWFGNTYLFAYDQKLNVLLNPAFPKRVGTNPSGEKDAKGKAFHDEFLNVAQTKGSGWVDYMFPKPGQTELSKKWSYVKATNINGTPAIIGAGFYDTMDDVRRSFVASPDIYKVIGENEQYRIIEATWQPGQRDKLHSHGKTVASYALTDCQMRNHLPDGKTQEGERKAGSTSVRTANLNHSMENVGKTVCKQIIFELK